MSRAMLILANPAVREKAITWIKNAPIGTRVVFHEAVRSKEQNDRMWAMLTDISKQKEHYGVRHDTETWKAIFMNALDRETRFIPTLDGKGVFPLAYRSSELSKKEMSDLLAMLEAWGAENGVTFHDKTRTESA